MSWTIVPVGKAMLILHPDMPTTDEFARAREMCEQLTKITAIPWVFIGNASLAEPAVVKEIAERFYGIKR